MLPLEHTQAVFSITSTAKGVAFFLDDMANRQLKARVVVYKHDLFHDAPLCIVAQSACDALFGNTFHLNKGNGHGKRAAHAQIAFHRAITAMHAGELARRSKPKPASPI